MRALLGQIGRDFRQACRSIIAAPGVAAVIIGSLGVGIGVNTTVFTWIESQILNPMPGVRDGGSFRLIEPITESGAYAGSSWTEFRDLQPRLTTFSDLIAFRLAPFTIGDTEWTERAYGQFVSPNYFAALGLKPAVGRLFDASSDQAWQPGGDPVVVVSYSYWQSKLGAAADVAGRPIRVNDRPMTIIGVAPKGFQGTTLGLSFDVFVPATLVPVMVPNSADLTSRGMRGYSIIGRLQPQAAVADASRQVDDAMRELARTYPDTNAGVRAEVLPFSQSPRGPQRMIVGALAILQLAMLLVLLAVCGNTANLTLARASARRREIGVRLALGASRTRVVSLLLMESLLLGMLGAVAGAAIAFWGTDALRAVPMPTPMGLTVRFQTGIDATALVFAMSLGLISGLIFGLAPAAQLARTNPQASLRATAGVAGRSRLRDILMVVEVALALVVLVVAALFLESFNDTRTLDPGFKRDGVVLAAYDLSGRSAASDPPGFAARVLETVRALPAVESAAIATSVPLDIHGMPSRTFTVEGHTRADGKLDDAVANTVTPDYFRTMGIAMRAGTGFADLRDPSAPPQVVVNEAFVRRYLSDVEPLGRRITSGNRAYVVSGIVADSLQNAFGEPPTPALYFSMRDRPSATAEIHIRARDGAEAAVVPDVRRAIRTLDPALPLYNVRTLNDHVDANLVFRRIPARIFAVLAPLLLVVAATGIYAIVAYAVSQRRVEMGVRLALGATRTRVAREIVGDVLRVAGVGAGAGWIVAFMIDRVMSGGSIDVRVFVGVPIVLLLVAALASYLPARRAGRIDPMVALKQE